MFHLLFLGVLEGRHLFLSIFCTFLSLTSISSPLTSLSTCLLFCFSLFFFLCHLVFIDFAYFLCFLFVLFFSFNPFSYFVNIFSSSSSSFVLRLLVIYLLIFYSIYLLLPYKFTPNGLVEITLFLEFLSPSFFLLLITPFRGLFISSSLLPPSLIFPCVPLPVSFFFFL